jgi:hypothetical protein
MSTEEQKQSIESWFAEYDELSMKGDIEGMANMAMFPVHVVTEGADGNGYTENWTRAQFIETMTEAMKDAPKAMEMRAVRTPFFLSQDLAVVITDAEITVGTQKQAMRYADILVKMDGTWKFQTMAQSGWGDMLKAKKAT